MSHSSTFKSLADKIKNTRGAKVVIIGSTRRRATMRGHYGETVAPLVTDNGKTFTLHGTVKIYLSTEAAADSKDFASIVGHELKHSSDFVANPTASERSIHTRCTCQGGNEFERAAYDVQHEIDNEISH